MNFCGAISRIDERSDAERIEVRLRRVALAFRLVRPHLLRTRSTRSTTTGAE